MRRSRSQSGQTFLTELPVVLWIIFIVFLFPLVNYATCGLRAIFVFNAVNQASLDASKSRNFTDAQQVASTSATISANSWTGITLNSVSTQIVATNLTTLVQTRSPSALSAPADLSKNTYQTEVTLDTSVFPLVTVNFPIDVPGMTQAMHFIATQRNYVENSQGLTQ